VGYVAGNELIQPRERLQRLVDDLGSTLLKVLDATGPLHAEVTGVVIFDPHDDLLVAPGELVLGVGVEGEAETVALVERLAALQASALVIKTRSRPGPGCYESVRRHGVPLLGLTPAASWLQVAELLRTPLRRRAASGSVDLVGNPAGDLFAFANAVSELMDAPVTIEDRSSRVVAFSGRQDEADAARVSTILGRQVPPRYRQMLEERGVFRQLYRTGDPVYVPSLDPDMLPRLAVGIRAGAEVLGSVWVAVSEPPSDERVRALANAAGVAALHMLHERNTADLRRRLSADLIQSLLEGAPGMAEAAARLGLPDVGLCVLACQPLGPQGTRMEAASDRLNDALALHLSVIHSGAAVARIGRRVYAVLPGHGEPEEAACRIQAVAASFAALTEKREPVAIGIAGPARSLQDLGRIRAEAERALRVVHRRGRPGRAARFEDVYLETILDRLGDLLASDHDTPRGPVARLRDYDADNGTDLTASLLSYLEAFGDIGCAAAAVHVHPNTFRYRIRRVREVSGIDLDDPRARLAALVQLSALRWQD
jgi:sugar diacid utilization regulator